MHKFAVLGSKLLFDENSNSLHEIDELVWDILEAPELTEESVLQHLQGRHNHDDVIEALAELQALEKQGEIFVPELPQPLMPAGEPMVKALCLHMAHDCNLRCMYCFAGTGPFGGCRELMPRNVGKAALDMLVRTSGPRRNLEVDFFGGEPLLNFDVVKELVSYGRKLEEQTGKRFRFTLTTNATLLTQEVKDFLNTEKIAVVLSLDGRREVNDLARPFTDGQGSYDQIIPDMLDLAASRHHDNYYVRGTYTRHNLDFSADVQHMVELGFKQVSVEPVVGAPDDHYTFKPEDIPALGAEYERLAEYYVNRYQAGNPFTFFHFNLSLDHGPCAIKRATGCGAGYDYLAVSPSGELYPCHQFMGMEEMKLGTVFTGVENLARSQEFQKVSFYQKEDCVGCWARFFCSGGCLANAHFSSGDFLKPDKLACELQKKRLECALYVQSKTRA